MDNVDQEEKLNAWEKFYNFHRPHSAFNGKTILEQQKPIEVLITFLTPGLN
jgi:hypothetical protein